MTHVDISECDRLHALVRRHHVRYHVWPEVWRTRPNQTTQVGYVIELAADAPGEATPGCRQCQMVFADLRTIARAVLPPMDRPSQYEIEAFDAAWHGRRHPEVLLNIVVLHRSDGTAPPGDCQRRCVAEMKDRLAALGAVERSAVPV